MFDTPDNSLDWARRFGLVRECPEHNTTYDVYVGCPLCNQAKAKIKRDKPMRKPKADIFSQVIWLETKENGGDSTPAEDTDSKMF